jgi:hypothetical protein
MLGNFFGSSGPQAACESETKSFLERISNETFKSTVLSQRRTNDVHKLLASLGLRLGAAQ